MPIGFKPQKCIPPVLSLLLLCSCATPPHSPPPAPVAKLPADIKMDRDAGRGSWLFVMVRLESGEELPFFLDTGASGTCFDKSLEPLLGKRMGTDTSWHFGVKGDAGVYLSPKLYLGGAHLEMTGPNVATIDLSAYVETDLGRPIAGVLGMDVLEHYCIQLDFAAATIRFLDGAHADRSGWGKAFSLTNAGDAYPTVSANLLGSQDAGSLIDTGCNSDGWLRAPLFDQWTNTAAAAEGQARSPGGRLDGDSYSELELQRVGEDTLSSGDSHMKVNGIGLRFLARHLVTFDFPGKTMYLKRTSTGPLVLSVKEQKSLGRSAYRFVASLAKRDQLPGWSRTDNFPREGRFYGHTLNMGTLSFQTKGNREVYHYRVTRADRRSPWKLTKAWRTDESGRTMAEYAVP